jgi:uncharacterized membrane protein
MAAEAVGLAGLAAGVAGAVCATTEVVMAEAKMADISWNFIDSPLKNKKRAETLPTG